MGKQRIANTEGGEKVGRITPAVARKAHIKSAPIVIDKNHLTHIENEHKKELLTLNISAYDYVRVIVNNFDQIRERPNSAVMLVKTNSIPPHDTCIAELHYDSSAACWQVKTAQPRRNIDNSKLLWNKKGGR